MGIECFFQLGSKGLVYMSPEDQAKAQGEYGKREIIRGRLASASKTLTPSIIQNNLLHACFALVASHWSPGDKPIMKTKKGVKLACKIGIDFRDQDIVIVRPDGGVQFVYLSFNMRELKGQRRLRVMDQAFEWCADYLGCSVEEMVAEAQEKMQRR